MGSLCWDPSLIGSIVRLQQIPAVHDEHTTSVAFVATGRRNCTAHASKNDAWNHPRSIPRKCRNRKPKRPIRDGARLLVILNQTPPDISWRSRSSPPGQPTVDTLYEKYAEENQRKPCRAGLLHLRSSLDSRHPHCETSPVNSNLQDSYPGLRAIKNAALFTGPTSTAPAGTEGFPQVLKPSNKNKQARFVPWRGLKQEPKVTA